MRLPGLMVPAVQKCAAVESIHVAKLKAFVFLVCFPWLGTLKLSSVTRLRYRMHKAQ